MRQNIEQIEYSVKELATLKGSSEFAFAFLRAFGEPETTITRLKQGDYNSAKYAGEILLKRKIFFKIASDKDCYVEIDELKNDKHIRKNKPRFIIVTDWVDLLAIDTARDDTLSCKFEELPDKFVFFLPLAGMEKEEGENEDVVSTKAAENVAKLHDFITHGNPDFDPHAMNVFFARLLFCFFAEDTDIFKQNAFTNAIASHTQDDGSDLSSYIARLFQRLNDKKDSKYPSYLRQFPYTNGGLFDKKLPVPKFSRRSREEILACGKLNWRGINPDIFGSMMQAVINTKERSNLGMHYTSPQNIMKVIKPLFLDDLHKQLQDAGGSKKKLEKLHQRLANLRIFDPACGSGNFLIISYKKLRELEMDIFDKLYAKQKVFTFSSNISLQQFYGIEIDAFACELAKLSLYLAEHQMNIEFNHRFDNALPTLPLKESGNITYANALRLDWHDVCPREKDKEIYVLGNPPYSGRINQTDQQKDDKDVVFKQNFKKYGHLDYISCWFYKGSRYISGIKAQLAFVSTNSVTQGEQVALLWPHIFSLDLEIGFAYLSFKWSNLAKGSSGVACVIINLRKASNYKKKIYDGKRVIKADNINPYLADGENLIISKQSRSGFGLPQINTGNGAYDEKNLLLDTAEKDELIATQPSSKHFIRKLLGSQEFINGQERWCLWISDNDLSKARAIPEIKDRIAKVKKFRSASKRQATINLAQRPHQFDGFKSAQHSSIIVPIRSSERREYIPIGFLDKHTIISNTAFALYDPPTYLFSLLSSQMHMVWVKSFGGKLETRISYSSDLCYNTFPVPELTTAQKNQLEEHTRNVIEAREQYVEKTLAQLYNPDEMPENLRQAHQDLDRAVEQLYQPKPFANDSERLACLLKLYSKMTEEKKVA